MDPGSLEDIWRNLQVAIGRLPEENIPQDLIQQEQMDPRFAIRERLPERNIPHHPIHQEQIDDPRVAIRGRLAEGNIVRHQQLQEQMEEPLDSLEFDESVTDQDRLAFLSMVRDARDPEGELARQFRPRPVQDFGRHSAARKRNLETMEDALEFDEPQRQEFLEFARRESARRNPGGLFSRMFRSHLVQEFRMHSAARSGDLEMVRELLELRRHAINDAWSDGNTPLLLAAREGHKDVVLLLLENGARVDSVGNPNNEFTFFHDVVRHGWTDVVQRILETGQADVNVATHFRRETPLMLAAREGYNEIAALLVRAGADCNCRNQSNWTALHKAAAEGHARVVQVLLQGSKTLDLNCQDKDGCTPLHRACNWGHNDIVKKLLLAGADIGLKNNNKETAFRVGMRRDKFGAEEIVLFLRFGAVFEDSDYEKIAKNQLLRDMLWKMWKNHLFPSKFAF